MRNSFSRRAGVALVIGFLALGTTACATETAPDEIGLYFERGSFEGYKFAECVEPGDVAWTVNDEVIKLPRSLRYWKIAPESTDTTVPITVPSAPDENQSSGTLVNVWSQTNFKLNTDCSKGAESPIVKFWEDTGRRHKANTVDGWRSMMQATIVTALETVTAQVVRQYPADVLVAGTKKDEIQQAISAAFTPELRRLVGGDYFCGPTFSPTKPDVCPSVEVLLLPIDYANEDIRKARDAKQAAIEQAAALLIEAQGKVAAANETGRLYDNPGWVELEVLKAQLQMVQACAANPECTIILGADGVPITIPVR